MAVRLRHLHLNLSVPSEASSRRDQLVDRARHELVRGALAVCEREVRRRLGAQAVVRVRSLRVALDLALGHTTSVEVLGRDLAEHIVRSARASRSWASAGPRAVPAPDPRDSVVWFEDAAEAHAVACIVSARGGERPWYTDGLSASEDPWIDAAIGGAPHFEAVIAHLLRAGQLQAVLRATPEAAVRRSLEVRPGPTWTEAAIEALATVRPELLGSRTRPAVRTSSDEGSSALRKSLAEDPSGLRKSPGGDSLGGPPVEAPSSGAVEPLPSGVTDAGREAAPISSALPPTQSHRQEELRSGRRAPTAEPRDGRREDLLVSPSPPEARAREHIPDGAPEAVPPPPVAPAGSVSLARMGGAPLDDAGRAKPIARDQAVPLSEGPPLEASPPASPAVYDTAFAGLFYLPRTLMQLEVGEHLWCAGLDGAGTWYALADHLVGGAHDAAVGLFAGLQAPAPVEAPDVPDWALREVKDKLRTALWAFSKGGLGDDLELFDARVPALAAWPSSDAGEDLVACLTAALVLAVGHRLGVEPSIEVLRGLITQVGRVLVRPERVDVLLPMQAVNSEVRRAGLDINPGWVPWMKAKLEIQFGSDRDEI